MASVKMNQHQFFDNDDYVNYAMLSEPVDSEVSATDSAYDLVDLQTISAIYEWQANRAYQLFLDLVAEVANMPVENLAGDILEINEAGEGFVNGDYVGVVNMQDVEIVMEFAIEQYS